MSETNDFIKNNVIYKGDTKYVKPKKKMTMINGVLVPAVKRNCNCIIL